MNSRIKNPVWITAVVVLAMAITLVGSSLMAGDKSTGQGCTMMGSDAMKSCPMSKDGGAMGMMNSCAGCAKLDGKVLSVNKDGSITVQVKPAAGNKSFAQLKRGDIVPLMVMLGENGKPCQMTKHGSSGTSDKCCASGTKAK